MLTDIIQFFSLPRFSTGRRIFACGQVLDAARRQENAELLIDLIERSTAQDRATLALEARWREQRANRSRARGRAVELDNEIDRLLGGMFTTVSVLVGALRTGDRASEGRAFLRSFFPEGAGSITNMRFEDQLAVMEEMLTRLAAMSAEQIDRLNIGFYVEELRRLVPEFERELREHTREDLRFDVVRAARQEGHENMLLLLATIYATRAGRDEADTRARRELIGPIIEQAERIRARRRTRPSGHDVEVDPETGEEHDQEDDVDPSDPEE
jgi:hypothetical protein